MYWMGVQIPDGKGQFCGGKGLPIVKYRHFVAICAKTVELVEMLVRLWTWMDPGTHVLDAGTDSPWEEVIYRGDWSAAHCKV